MLLCLTAIIISACGSSSKSSEEIASENHPSTLLVVGKAQGIDAATLSQGGVLYSCSGWVYNAEENLVVTNAHCVSAPKVLVGESSTELVPATLVAVDNEDDVAVLRVTGLSDSATEIPLADESTQGEAAFVLGYPGNGKPNQLQTPYQVQEGTVTATSGVQAQVDYDGFYQLWSQLGVVNDNAGITLQNLTQTSASTTHGGSGGPVVNDQGEIIGMTVAGSSEGNQNDAVGLTTLQDVLPELASGQSIAYLGVTLSAVPDEFANLYGVDGFLLVGSVIPNSPIDQQTDQRVLLQKATKLGLFLAVTTINGQTVTTQEELINLLDQVSSGEQVKIHEYGVDLKGNPTDLGTVTFTAP